MASSQIIIISKDNRIAGAATALGALGSQSSLWENEGYPSHGAVPPTSFAIPDNTVQGALPFIDPATGKQKWLHTMVACPPFGSSGNGGMIHLYDRLLHISGLSGIVTTAQNINGGSDAAVTRHYTDIDNLADVGNEIWLEIYTLIGATPTTVTCSYKNENGVLHTTVAQTFGGTKFREQARFINLPLAAGDRGVSAVVSVTVLATTGTAGNFGLVIAHRLCSVIASSGSPGVYTCAIDDQIEIKPGACLALFYELQGGVPATALQALPLAQLSMVEC